MSRSGSSSGGGSGPLTTKGDLYGFTISGARVPVGADAQGLVADSTQATGLRWSGDTAYIAPVLGNSWVNVAAGHEVAGYMKDALGFVHLRGYITGGASGAVAFTLPVGYRPAATVQAPGNGFTAGDAIASNGWTYIDNTGAVAPQGATVTRFSLDGITFLAGA